MANQLLKAKRHFCSYQVMASGRPTGGNVNAAALPMSGHIHLTPQFALKSERRNELCRMYR